MNLICGHLPRGLDYPIMDKVNQELIAGSEWYKSLFDNGLTPSKQYEEVTTDVNQELKIHNL